jgi:hypothetical protein
MIVGVEELAMKLGQAESKIIMHQIVIELE